ncbi:hypothetical protein CC80DRAFT_220110 [Byssothecium circinans]|uniref:BZIP domain-containing protein n=1 Tax=Byssothecium circinans TaxID=147558 RepID=A0A6A5TPR7_9PLEO|nr:hypothetical protein CC80DRAFT_220110 [Byssothecium circinans]
MYTTHILQSHGARQPGRQTPSVVGQEPEKRPKKVNSEIRKQQNRIASRNYREKRKRKLQYLQQLIRDEGSAEDEPVDSTEHEHTQDQRVLSPEYFSPAPVARNMTLPSNEHYPALSSSSGNVIQPTLAATTAPYPTQYPGTAPTYSHFEPPWTTPLYDIPPPVNISTWNIPTWIPNIEFSPPMTTRSADDFRFTPPPHSHDSFDLLPSPPSQAHTPDPDLFMMGTYSACRRRPEQGMGNSCMSLPSSPFFHPRYTS